MEDALKRRAAWALLLALAAFTLVAAVQRWLEVYDVAGRVLPIGFPRRTLTVWASAFLGGSLFAVATRRPLAGLGLALMCVPLWSAFWAFLSNIPAVTDTGTVLDPISRYRLSSNYIRSLLVDIGYLGTGFLLWTGRIPASVRDLAASLRAQGLRTGRTEGTSIGFGYAVFPLFLAGAWGLQWAIQRATPGLVSGDISAYWENMTWYHAMMIAAAAAFTEELVYRVLGLSLAVWALAKAGLGPRAALIGAVLAQAALFGAAHGGYGSWQRIVEAGAFGLVAGVLVVEAGVWAAVVVHFLVDFFVFASYRLPQDAWAAPLLWTLLGLNVVVAAWLALRWSRDWRAHGTPPWRTAPKAG